MAEKTSLPTKEEIDQMKLGKLTRLLRDKFDMTSDETDDMEIEEARTELERRIREAQETGKRPGQAQENLRDIVNTHNSKRKDLAELCSKITAYLATLDGRVKDNLKIQLDREVEDMSKDIQSNLDKEECRILVTGETSSGKSTFLNLLLEEDILPVAHSSSTSAICEVKYGDTKQAVVHLRKANDQGERRITIPLDGTKEHRDELKHYIHLEGANRERLPPAQLIEIFLPLSLLKGGIVLVDSPGVGETDKMDDLVADYIPKAFAFLYIIDSSRAGGVQQDRVGCLLKLYTKNAEVFDPEAAMFVCNKWDTVPQEEQDDLKTETLRKLSDMWPGLEESQVFFVSTRKALRLGILSEDFTKVLDGLDLLLEKSLDIKLDTQYRLLTRLLSEALTHIKRQLTVAHHLRTEGDQLRKYEEAKQHLQSFADEATNGQSMGELKVMLTDNVENTKGFLSDLVKNGNLRNDLMAVPKFLLMREQVALVKFVKRGDQDSSRLKDLYEVLANTLAHVSSSFKKFITPLKKSFRQQLKDVAESCEKAQQRAMSAITGSPCPVSRMEVRDFLSEPNAFFRGWKIAYLLWPEKLSAAGAFLSKWEASSSTVCILQQYCEQAPEGTPLVDILIQALSSSEELITELADRQMQPQRDLMALLEADITKMRTIMEQTIDQTFQDARGNEEIKETYEPRSEKISCFLGQLTNFYLTETRKYEYKLDSITGWTDTENRIGGGSFGEVYRVQVPRKGAETPAALKLGVHGNKIITHETALEFQQEEENLRKLKGKHIVEYYGTAYKKEGGLRLGLVMELCEGTLEDRIIGQWDCNPAWWGSNPEKQKQKHLAAFRYTQNLAVQLCEGLKHIHDAGYIHRDLKLINVLVTKDNTVKLADVGLTKREDKITGTVAGTPLYAAPEVKERKVYDKSADIYSLGLILFEMWYGRALYGLQDAAYAKEMEEDLKKGHDIGMPRWPDAVPPIDEWTSLIHDCLRVDPKERPKIQECLDRISDMKIE